MLDAEQLNKIIKLQDGQGKIKMHYGTPEVKKQLSGKGILCSYFNNLNYDLITYVNNLYYNLIS